MSQNSSCINTTPSTNNTNVSLGSKTSQNSSDLAGNLKTALGEIAISLENSTEISSEINNYMSLILNSSLNENNSPFFSCHHNITFISPESVEIEIEISNLLSDLQKLDSHSHTTHSETKSLPFNSSDSPKIQPPSPFFSSFSSSPKTSYKSSFFANKTTLTPLSGIKDVSIEKNTLHQKAHSFEKRSSLLKKDDLIQVQIENSYLSKEEKKTLPSFRQEKQDKDHKQQNQQQQEHQQKKEQTQGKKEEKKVLKCGEVSINSLSIEELRYRNSLKQFKKNDEVSPCLKKKLDSPIKVFNASLSSKEPKPASHKKVDIENIFIKFMHLMARILGQAEAEAHELYLKIKERTDNIDLLTLLLSKVNSEKEDINWEDNEEMKLLVNKARSFGVDIPYEKYFWTEEEKKLLKENIQMKKDSMEKITQLERTDMQRYLQEVSQCHQTRSNVLKLLKEIIDTFVYNLRP